MVRRTLHNVADYSFRCGNQVDPKRTDKADAREILFEYIDKFCCLRDVIGAGGAEASSTATFRGGWR